MFFPSRIFKLSSKERYSSSSSQFKSLGEEEENKIKSWIFKLTTDASCLEQSIYQPGIVNNKDLSLTHTANVVVFSPQFSAEIS